MGTNRTRDSQSGQDMSQRLRLRPLMQGEPAVLRGLRHVLQPGSSLAQNETSHEGLVTGSGEGGAGGVRVCVPLSDSIISYSYLSIFGSDISFCENWQKFANPRLHRMGVKTD